MSEDEVVNKRKTKHFQTPYQVKATAKKFYMEGMEAGTISQKLNVKYATVQNWITGQGGKTEAWKEQREKAYKTVVAKVVDKTIREKEKLLPGILQIGLELIQKTFEHRLAETAINPMTIREAKEVSDIVSNIDKLMRLEAGTATEIVNQQYGPVTIEQLKNAIRNDPFLEAIPFTAEEIQEVSPEQSEEKQTIEVESEVVDPFISE